MRIYLASRYSRREELKRYREDLHEAGHIVTSRWLNGDHEVHKASLDEERSQAEQGFAIEDRDDVLYSDLVISFTEKPRSENSRGGRHVEYGIAIGANIPNWIVGPRENVFHLLPDVFVFSDWKFALQAIRAGICERSGSGSRCSNPRN